MKKDIQIIVVCTLILIVVTLSISDRESALSGMAGKQKPPKDYVVQKEVTAPSPASTSGSASSTSMDSTAENGKAYIYAGSRLISRVESPSFSEVFFYHQDSLGGTTAVTNDVGEVISSQNYMPFGEEINKVGEEKYTYNSKEFNSETGLYYYGARYYDADIGRFTTADTVKGKIEDPQSQNLYVYVKNNPLKYVDPTGHEGEMHQLYDSKGKLVKGVTYRVDYKEGRPHVHFAKNGVEFERRLYVDANGEVFQSIHGNPKADSIPKKIVNAFLKSTNKKTTSQRNMFLRSTERWINTKTAKITNIDVSMIKYAGSRVTQSVLKYAPAVGDAVDIALADENPQEFLDNLNERASRQGIEGLANRILSIFELPAMMHAKQKLAEEEAMKKIGA